MRRAKAINVVLEQGTIDGIIDISFKGDGNIMVFSAPRKNIEDLLEIEQTSFFGVYLLLSDKKVYVGQATDLKRRLKNHILNKEWWNRVVIMTTESNWLNHSDIDYLESILIEKAQKNHSLDSENKKAGNKVNLQRGDEVALQNYLEDAFLLLDFIGVQVFGGDDNKDKQRMNLVSTKVLQLTQQSFATDYLKEMGYISKDFSYAKRNDKKDYYPIDPQLTKLNDDWTIVLNDTIGYCFYIIEIPNNSIDEKDIEKFKRRNDHPNQLTMIIEGGTFIEKRSGFDFSKYVVHTVPYEE